jgi:hypothetical protein
MPGISDEERAYHDSQARAEAWDRAIQILRPWVASTAHIGSEELRLVMLRALDDAMEAYNTALREGHNKERSAE